MLTLSHMPQDPLFSFVKECEPWTVDSLYRYVMYLTEGKSYKAAIVRIELASLKQGSLIETGASLKGEDFLKKVVKNWEKNECKFHKFLRKYIRCSFTQIHFISRSQHKFFISVCHL